MAANDEFPRGGILASIQNASGVAATITIPAVAGVSHVLDSIHAFVKEYVALGAATGYPLIVKDGANTLPAEGWNPILIPANGDSDSYDDPGPNILTGTVNAALTVQFTVAPGAGVMQELAIKWHDI